MFFWLYFWLVVPFRERQNFIGLLKTYNCQIHYRMHKFPTYEIIFLSKSRPRVMLKIYLKFRNFQPRYYQKMQFLIKKEEFINTCLTPREKTGRLFDVPLEPTRSV